VPPESLRRTVPAGLKIRMGTSRGPAFLLANTGQKRLPDQGFFDKIEENSGLNSLFCPSYKEVAGSD